MNILDFTAEKASLIAIYVGGTRTATIAAITDALPHMDAGFTALADSSVTKLAAMSDEDFAAATFIADDDGGE
jgi:hypothetical protein